LLLSWSSFIDLSHPFALSYGNFTITDDMYVLAVHAVLHVFD
jgi:hypothetical protein